MISNVDQHLNSKKIREHDSEDEIQILFEFDQRGMVQCFLCNRRFPTFERFIGGHHCLESGRRLFKKDLTSPSSSTVIHNNSQESPANRRSSNVASELKCCFCQRKFKTLDELCRGHRCLDSVSRGHVTLPENDNCKRLTDKHLSSAAYGSEISSGNWQQMNNEGRSSLGENDYLSREDTRTQSKENVIGAPDSEIIILSEQMCNQEWSSSDKNDNLSREGTRKQNNENVIGVPDSEILILSEQMCNQEWSSLGENGNLSREDTRTQNNENTIGAPDSEILILSEQICNQEFSSLSKNGNLSREDTRTQNNENVIGEPDSEILILSELHQERGNLAIEQAFQVSHVGINDIKNVSQERAKANEYDCNRNENLQALDLEKKIKEIKAETDFPITESVIFEYKDKHYKFDELVQGHKCFKEKNVHGNKDIAKKISATSSVKIKLSFDRNLFTVTCSSCQNIVRIADVSHHECFSKGNIAVYCYINGTNCNMCGQNIVPELPEPDNKDCGNDINFTSRSSSTTTTTSHNRQQMLLDIRPCYVSITRLKALEMVILERKKNSLAKNSKTTNSPEVSTGKNIKTQHKVPVQAYASENLSGSGLHASENSLGTGETVRSPEISLVDCKRTPILSHASEESLCKSQKRKNGGAVMSPTVSTGKNIKTQHKVPVQVHASENSSGSGLHASENSSGNAETVRSSDISLVKRIRTQFKIASENSLCKFQKMKNGETVMSPEVSTGKYIETQDTVPVQLHASENSSGNGETVRSPEISLVDCKRTPILSHASEESLCKSQKRKNGGAVMSPKVSTGKNIKTLHKVPVQVHSSENSSGSGLHASENSSGNAETVRSSDISLAKLIRTQYTIASENSLRKCQKRKNGETVMSPEVSTGKYIDPQDTVPVQLHASENSSGNGETVRSPEISLVDKKLSHGTEKSLRSCLKIKNKDTTTSPKNLSAKCVRFGENTIHTFEREFDSEESPYCKNVSCKRKKRKDRKKVKCSSETSSVNRPKCSRKHKCSHSADKCVITQDVSLSHKCHNSLVKCQKMENRETKLSSVISPEKCSRTLDISLNESRNSLDMHETSSVKRPKCSRKHKCSSSSDKCVITQDVSISHKCRNSLVKCQKMENRETKLSSVISPEKCSRTLDISLHESRNSLDMHKKIEDTETRNCPEMSSEVLEQNMVTVSENRTIESLKNISPSIGSRSSQAGGELVMNDSDRHEEMKVEVDSLIESSGCKHCGQQYEKLEDLMLGHKCKSSVYGNISLNDEDSLNSSCSLSVSIESDDDINTDYCWQSRVMNSFNTVIVQSVRLQRTVKENERHSQRARRQQEEQSAPPQPQEEPPPPYSEHDYEDQYYPPPPAVIIIAEDVGSDGETFRSGRRHHSDYEVSDERFGSSFSTKKIRAAFIRKVYILLTLMLLVTAGICSIFMYVQPVRKFVRKHWWLILIAFVVYLTVAITLICCTNVRRRYPLNIVLLAIYTLATALPLAVLTAFYDTLTVLMALGTTVGLCLIVTLFACQTKWDITGWGAYLAIALLAFMLFSLVAFIIQLFIDCKILHLIIAGIGTLIFAVFLMYDTQQIMGGKRVEISPEEYVYGAMTLYLDVIQIFCYMLQIFAVCRGG